MYADMGRRLVARIIDGLLLSVVYTPLYVVMVAGAATTVTVDPQTGQLSNSSVGMFSGALIGFDLLLFAIGFAYEVSMIALRGATVGKQVMGVRVVREADGQVPGWGPAALRWLIPFVGIFACCIGEIVVYLSPFFDGTRRFQGWHDKVAKTLVIRT
jgi:uncharacterized RDD family membrane protein YckC